MITLTEKDEYCLETDLTTLEGKTELLNFLQNSSFPEKLTLIVNNENFYTFGTSSERFQFSLGFILLWKIIA